MRCSSRERIHSGKTYSLLAKRPTTPPTAPDLDWPRGPHWTLGFPRPSRLARPLLQESGHHGNSLDWPQDDKQRGPSHPAVPGEPQPCAGWAHQLAVGPGPDPHRDGHRDGHTDGHTDGTQMAHGRHTDGPRTGPQTGPRTGPRTAHGRAHGRHMDGTWTGPRTAHGWAH